MATRAAGVTLRVRVQPRASRNRMLLEPDGRIRISLTAPPVDGEANVALCRFVAAELGVPKSTVSVVSGEKSREKTLRITAESSELKKLLAHLRGVETAGDAAQ